MVANSGVSSSENAGCSASSSAIAASRSPTSVPTSASSSSPVSRSRRRSGRYPAIREINVASLGTEPSATPGIVVSVAVPRAVTRAASATFSPTLTVITVRPSASTSRSAAPSLSCVVRADVRPLVHQPRHADALRAILLVGLRDEDDVTAGAEPAAGQGGHRHRPRRGLVLHVRRAAPPQEAVVVQVARERGVPPVLRSGRHDVGVPDQRHRRALARPRDAGDQVRPVGVAGDQLAGHAVRLEVALEQRRRRRLAAGRIRRVDPQQVAQELRRLVAQVALVHAVRPGGSRCRAARRGRP